jgi:hypothetical protein
MPLPTKSSEVKKDLVGGWTVPVWGGINAQDAPHLMADNEFQLGVNLRWHGRTAQYLEPRGGQSKYSPGVISAGYALWGAYGGVMQHGGMGGIGFKDAPDDETPSSFGGPVALIWSTVTAVTP